MNVFISGFVSGVLATLLFIVCFIPQILRALNWAIAKLEDLGRRLH